MRIKAKASETEKVLVTGGAGFIGSHLVDALIGRGYKATILDNLSSGRLNNIETHLNCGDAKLLERDIKNSVEVKECFTGVDVVFHLAAIASVPYSIENPILTNKVNVEGTRNLLEAAVQKSVKLFVFASSCAVYGEPQYLPIDERHPTDPKSPYAESKLKGEELCREYNEDYGLRTVILRLFNVFGPRQGGNKYSSVITEFISSVRKGKPPIIHGDGNQTRDFTYVDDAVEALLLSSNVANAVGEIFNIGFGKPVTVNELCRLVLKKYGAKLEPILTEARAGDIKRSYSNIEKAHRILGYQPRISLEEGLERVIDW